MRIWSIRIITRYWASKKSASKDDIKKAYRKLAMKYHPDQNAGDKGAEEKFKEINEAYQVLGNEEQRARYDQLGSSYHQWQQTGGRNDFNWADWFTQQPGGQGVRGQQNMRVDMGDFEDMFGGGFSDFFNMIFGGSMRQQSPYRTGGSRRAVRPRNYEQPVQISFHEAYKGGERMVQVDGRRLRVKIPAGAKTGTKIRMANAGPASAGGGRADLYLVIDVAEDKRFERKKDDLYTDVNIDLYTAVLGGQADVVTPDGKVVLTIPPGTQPGQSFRLAGRGMPKLRKKGEFGNLYAHVSVQIPKDLTPEQRKIFEQLRYQ